MNKASLIAAGLSVVSLLGGVLVAGAPLAEAQVYTASYPATTYTTPYTTPSYGYTSPVTTSACIELTAPLTIGVSDYLVGGQVSQLQTFLVRDGLLSSAYITGYYGQLTASAVAQFQASRGISPVGVVGPVTRAAIQQVSCGTTGIVSPSQPGSYPINPGGPIIYTNAPLELDSLSASNSTANIVITLKGSGFDPVNNTVHFGTAQVTGIASNGTQLNFNVPSVVPGTYQVYVSTSRGSTNSLSYYVSSTNNYNSGSNCGYYNGVYQCNCYSTTYNTSTALYNNCNTNGNYGAVVINSLSGMSGYVGSNVTIYGSGFTSNGNTIHLGNTVISNVYSSNGTSITFTVPSNALSSNNFSSTSYGSYSLYVTNGNDVSSNTIQFTVNGGGYTNNAAVSISSLSPSSGSVGTQIAINGYGFSAYGNTVYFGNGGQTNVQSYNDGDTLYFTVPSSLSPCSVTTNGGICPQYAQVVSSGQYPVYVTNQNGSNSNTLYFQVY